MKKLSVIIAGYNSTSDLDECLGSIETVVNWANIELIVVDSSSPDRSCLDLQKRFPRVTFYFLSTNRGFGAANNYGLEHASGEYILFLNPDTVLVEDSFKVGIDYLDQHPSVGALSFMLLYPDGVPQYCYNKYPGIKEEVLVTFYLDLFAHRRLVRKDYERRLKKGIPLKVDWVAGACLLTRRSILERIGGFDEDFFLFYEDIDLCRRIRSDGWEIYYVPLTSIIHKAGASTGSSVYPLVYHRNRSKYIYTHKHFNFLTRFVIFVLTEIGLLLRVAATLFLPYASKEDRQARRAAYIESARMYVKGIPKEIGEVTYG